MEEKSKKEPNLLKKFINYAPEYKSYFNKSIFYILISTLAWVGAFISAYFLIDGFISEELTKGLWVKSLVGIFLCLSLNALLKGQGLLNSHIFAYNSLAAVRKHLADKMLNNPLGFTLRVPAGDYRQKMVDSIEQIEMLLAHGIPEGFPYIVSFILIITMIFVVDWRLGLLAILPTFFSMFLMGNMYKSGLVKMNSYYAAAKNMSSNIVEHVGGIEVIKIFNQKDRSYKKLKDSIYNYRDFTLDWYRESWNTMAFVNVVGSTLSLLVLPVGVIFLKNGTLELSKLVFVSLLCFAGVYPLNRTLFFFPIIAQLNQKLIDLEKDFDSPELKTGTEILPLENIEIEYKDLCFGYDEVEVLHDINFTIEPKTTVAFVGESGSGKSTLAKLLMHYYDVNSGDILINGKSITSYDMDSLMGHLSYVSQDNFLFDISIRENILMGNPDATEEELYEAAKVAHIHDFIMSLDDGYDTNVGESGNKLSGGERQRICIARAILKNTPIIILDEATSYTDPENEYYINEGIDALCKDKIVILIAHKLSRIMNADKIILLDEGKIAGMGTHEELLENKIYNNLWQRFSTAKKYEFKNKGEEHV